MMITRFDMLDGLMGGADDLNGLQIFWGYMLYLQEGVLYPIQ